MNPQDALLQQLRDIHGAADAAWWPPAPGWWVVAVLLLIGLYLVFRRLQQARREQMRKQGLITFIELIEQGVDAEREPQRYLSDLNRVFRLVALRAFPDQSCARLGGSQWTQFLSQRLSGQDADPVLQPLAEGPWQRVPEFDAKALGTLARQWVREHG